MLNKANIALYESMEQLCEPHPLLEQLGSMDGLFTLSKAAASLRRPPIKDLKSLVKFLEVYEARILLPLELPAIYWAHQHALRNETRELLKLDASIRELPALREFSSASQRVGQSHLKRLKPLRYERLVQRYIAAVDGGTAAGWHTLVYGVTLALYSIPVRQGLVNYARQTFSGFLHSAAKPLRLTEQDCRENVEHLCVNVRPRIELLLDSKKRTAFGS